MVEGKFEYQGKLSKDYTIEEGQLRASGSTNDCATHKRGR